MSVITNKQYRPYIGRPYQKVYRKIADELNKTSINSFNELMAARHCAFEMWKRLFPNEPFPKDADELRIKYFIDPEIVQSD